MRIGQGYDAHRLVLGRKLMLGGVSVPHPHGLAGHSDADVLIHAICDALLGAAALGDIGHYFPSSDPAYADLDSREILRKVADLLEQQAYQIHNIDSTIIAQSPKISPFISRMRENLASDLDLSIQRISIKATTTDHMGFVGREEGIAAQAIALIMLRD